MPPDFNLFEIRVFAPSPNPTGVQVFGVGPSDNMPAARVNALQRLSSWFEGHDRSEWPQPYRLLADALEGRDSVFNQTLCHLPGGFNPMGLTPEGFHSVMGEVVCMTLRSNYSLLSKVGDFALENGVKVETLDPEATLDGRTFKLALRTSIREILGTCGLPVGVSHHLVDWHEVAGEFSASEIAQAMQMERDRGNPALTPKPSNPGATAGSAAPSNEAESAELPTREIPPVVLSVLQQSRVDDGVLKLPDVQLNPKVYQAFKSFMNDVGGKWVGLKVQGFVFEDENAEEILENALTTGRFFTAKDVGYFPTLDPEVDRMLEISGIRPGMRVLEPSAGRGAIALKAAEVVGLANVQTCELLPSNARHLRAAGFEDVHTGDFLAVQPEPVYDLVLMNPPFTRGLDVKHVLHAARFLSPTGRLVAITSPGWEGNSNKQSADFRDFLADVEAEVETIAAGAFKTSGTGTMVQTRLLAMDACNFPWYRQTQIDHEGLTEAGLSPSFS